MISTEYGNSVSAHVYRNPAARFTQKTFLERLHAYRALKEMAGYLRPPRQRTMLHT